MQLLLNLLDLFRFKPCSVAAFSLIGESGNASLPIVSAPLEEATATTGTDACYLLDGVSLPIEPDGLKSDFGICMTTVLESQYKFVGFCFVQVKFSGCHNLLCGI